MRISVNPADPGYDNFQRHKGNTIKVFLNGIEQKGVHTADDEQDIIIRPKKDERGFAIAVGDEITLETKHGNVIIQTE